MTSVRKPLPRKIHPLSSYDISKYIITYIRKLKSLDEFISISLFKFILGQSLKEKFQIEHVINLKNSVWYKLHIDDNLISLVLNGTFIYKSLFDNIDIDECEIDDVKLNGCHHPTSEYAVFDRYLLRKKSNSSSLYI